MNRSSWFKGPAKGGAAGDDLLDDGVLDDGVLDDDVLRPIDALFPPPVRKVSLAMV